MKTFYEELLVDPTINEEIKEQLRNAFIVKADNVAEYLWANEKDKEPLTEEDFPNLAPPFKNMFIEYKEPLGSVFEFKIQIEEIFHEKYKFSNLTSQDGFLFIATEDKENEIRWSIKVIPFYQSKEWSSGERDLLIAPDYSYKVNKSGKINIENQNNFLDNIIVNWSEIEPKYGDRNGEIYENGIYTCFLAISLMHCKNVEIIPRGKGTNRKPGKRNRHEIRVRYHVLNIEPMKTILRTEGESEKRGLKYALHICRGHFKHFGGKNKKLFGRFEGDYWWSDQVRGKVAKGVVGKDYKIVLDIDEEINHG